MCLWEKETVEKFPLDSEMRTKRIKHIISFIRRENLTDSNYEKILDLTLKFRTVGRLTDSEFIMLETIYRISQSR